MFLFSYIFLIYKGLRENGREKKEKMESRHQGSPP